MKTNNEKMNKYFPPRSFILSFNGNKCQSLLLG